MSGGGGAQQTKQENDTKQHRQMRTRSKHRPVEGGAKADGSTRRSARERENSHHATGTHESPADEQASTTRPQEHIHTNTTPHQPPQPGKRPQPDKGDSPQPGGAEQAAKTWGKATPTGRWRRQPRSHKATPSKTWNQHGSMAENEELGAKTAPGSNHPASRLREGPPGWASCAAPPGHALGDPGDGRLHGSRCERSRPDTTWPTIRSDTSIRPQVAEVDYKGSGRKGKPISKNTSLEQAGARDPAARAKTTLAYRSMSELHAQGHRPDSVVGRAVFPPSKQRRFASRIAYKSGITCNLENDHVEPGCTRILRDGLTSRTTKRAQRCARSAAPLAPRAPAPRARATAGLHLFAPTAPTHLQQHRPVRGHDLHDGLGARSPLIVDCRRRSSPIVGALRHRPSLIIARIVAINGHHHRVRRSYIAIAVAGCGIPGKHPSRRRRHLSSSFVIAIMAVGSQPPSLH